MRKPSPVQYLTATLFGLAATAVHAASPMASSAPGTAAASPAPVVTTPAPSMAPSTSSTSATPSTTTSTSSNSVSSSSTSNAATMPGTTVPNETLRNQSTSQTNQATIGPTTDAASFGPDSPFVNNTNPQVGLSPGQTSTGTAAGNEPSGLENSTTTGTFTQNGTATLTGIATPIGAASTVVPAGIVGGGGYGGGAGTALGGTAVAISPGLPASSGSATPLLDQATRNAAQRDERRRATGNEPRIIGIAPRTNVDRTDEMPDDPIIRY